MSYTFGWRTRRVLEPVDIVDTKDIILPFRYTKTPDVILNTSFTPYDTFRFEMNFSPYLHLFNPRWRFQLVPKEVAGEMRLCVEIFEGAKFIPLNDEMVNILTPYVDLALKEDYIWLIDSKKSLTYCDTVMPSPWLQSILPFIETTSFPSLVKENGFYVDLRDLFGVKAPNVEGHSFRPLELGYNSLYSTILSKLRYLYVFGSVVLHDYKDLSIIQRWNLTRNPSLQHPTDTNLRIYHALWQNSLIALDKSRFLEQISFTQTEPTKDVLLTIRNPLNVRIEAPFPIRYSETHILAKVNNFTDANEFTHKFMIQN